MQASSFAKWLKSVRGSRDTIITTNYDTLIENTLMDITTPELPLSPESWYRDALHWLDYGVHRSKVHEYSDRFKWRTPPEQSLLLLKLHGSVSWLVCKNCDTYLLDPIWQHAKDCSLWPEIWPPCPECKLKGARRDGVIVPPLLRKDYSEPAIAEIWDRAREVLAHSEEIVFAGFSLDQSDIGVHGLLEEARGLRTIKRITIVDPNPSATEPRYRGLYGDLVNVAPEGDWEAYLQNHFF